MLQSDVRLLLITWILLAVSSGAYATTLATTELQFVDLPWLSIAGGCILSLLGGLTNTTRLMLASAKSGESIHVSRQIASDLCVALILGVVTFAVVRIMGKDVYTLLAALPIAGAGGARLLDPAINMAVRFVNKLSSSDPR